MIENIWITPRSKPDTLIYEAAFLNQTVFMKAANRTGTENRKPVHIEKSVNRVNRTE